MIAYNFDKAEVQLVERVPSAELLALYRRIRVTEKRVSAVTVTPDWLFRTDGAGFEAIIDYEVDPRQKVLIQLWSRYAAAGAIIRGDGTSLIGTEHPQGASAPLRFSRVVQGYSLITVGLQIASSFDWGVQVGSIGSTSNVIHATARIIN